MADGNITKRDVWDQWVKDYLTPSKPVPLFAVDENGKVTIKKHGRDNRPLLERSREMNDLLRREGRKVVDDWKGSDDTYEGLIYLMYTLEDDEVIPRYIGKAGKYGRDGKRLSANLKNIRTNNSKFARWGDDMRITSVN